MTKEVSMIDKLHLRTRTVVSDAVVNKLSNELNFQCHKVLDKNYGDCFIVKRLGEHILTVKRSPNLSNHWPTYLELNPSKYKSLHSMLEFLQLLDVDDQEAEIRRIDHCADMAISIELVRATLIVKRKKKRTDYEEGDSISGLYFGKNEEVISIYNKSLQMQKKKKLLQQPRGNWTRFEVRQKGKKIQHNKLSDIGNYLTVNPFINLLFYELSIPEMDMGKLSMRDRFFFEHIKEKGLHSTYKVLNNCNNFIRDHEKKLNQTSYSHQVTQQYHKTLKSFINGG